MVRWNELEFRQLEYAIAVKGHQGFLQAAITIGLDQGFLSKQIQRLEAKLGFALFDRTTRPLGVTEAGETFLVRAEKILEQTQRAIELAQALQDLPWETLDIAFIALYIQCQSLKDMLDVKNSVATTLENLDPIIKSLHKTTGLTI
jgi:DNA-binding transcriptional LysR family regulator